MRQCKLRTSFNSKLRYSITGAPKCGPVLCVRLQTLNINAFIAATTWRNQTKMITQQNCTYRNIYIEIGWQGHYSVIIYKEYVTTYSQVDIVLVANLKTRIGNIRVLSIC